jgi:hypothetical protein
VPNGVAWVLPTEASRLCFIKAGSAVSVTSNLAVLPFPTLIVLMLVAKLTPGIDGQLVPSKATANVAAEVPLLVTLMDRVRVVRAPTCRLPNETLTRPSFLAE